VFARLILPLDDGGAVPIAIVRLADRYAGPNGSNADANPRVLRIRSRYSKADARCRSQYNRYFHRFLQNNCPTDNACMALWFLADRRTGG
jgi:hypothetical protein